jgi:hypothetical protein
MGECPRHLGFSARVRLGTFLLLVGSVAGCGATLFQFDDTAPLNQPPPNIQKVGTADVDGPPGSVLMVSSPSGSGGRWLQIKRTPGQTSVSGFKANFTEVAQDGTYEFSCFLYIPSNVGTVTIQFEPPGQPVGELRNGLHIDFTQDNRVRIDDNESTLFGSFQRDHVFMVKVTLKLSATPTAHIDLIGAFASGSKDYAVPTALANVLRETAAARVWMGVPWTGTFYATTIVVKKPQ